MKIKNPVPVFILLSFLALTSCSRREYPLGVQDASALNQLALEIQQYASALRDTAKASNDPAQKDALYELLRKADFNFIQIGHLFDIITIELSHARDNQVSPGAMSIVSSGMLDAQVAVMKGLINENIRLAEAAADGALKDEYAKAGELYKKVLNEMERLRNKFAQAQAK